LKERTFYTINLDARRIAVIAMIILLLLVYAFILGHTIGKRSALRESKELAEKTETTKLLTNNRPTIKSDEESSLDALEEVNKQKPEVMNLNETEPVIEKTEVPVEKQEKTTKKKKQKKSNEEQRVYYTLQLGAFSSKEQAQKYVEKIISESRLSGGYYKPTVFQKGELHVVQVGKFASREEAESAKLRLDPKIQSTTIIQKASSIRF